MSAKLALAWIQHHQALLLTAGAILGCTLAAVALLVLLRRTSLARLLRGIAIPLVLLYEAQGVFALTLALGVPRDLAYVLSGVACAIILTLAAHAHEHYERTGGRDGGTLGPCGRWMWYVAVPMGLIIAAREPTLAGAGMRVILPLLSVLAFRARYVPDEPAGQEGRRGQWRVSPRRLAVAIGLIDPTDADLTSVHRERQVRQLTAHFLGYHDGWRFLKSWHGRRFRRLMRLADDEMTAEIRLRARRVRDGLTLAEGSADATAAPSASAAADATAAPSASASAAPSADGSAGPSAAPAADGNPAVARVRRRGSVSCTDDDIKAAIRELRKDDPGLTKYGLQKALKGNKGTIGGERAGRLLAEVEAERPSLHAVSE